MSNRDFEPLLWDWTTLGDHHVIEDAWRGFEYTYALLNDHARWAAKKESAIVITNASLKKKAVTLQITNSGKKKDTTVHVNVRNRDWTSWTDATANLALLSGTSSHTITLPKAPLHGTSALEISIQTPDKKTLAFGSQAINGGNAAITVDCTPLARDRNAAGSFNVSLTNHGTPGQLNLAVVDRFGRTVQADSQPVRNADPVNTQFTLRGSHAVDYYHELHVSFTPKNSKTEIVRGFGNVALMPEKLPYEYRFVTAIADPNPPGRKVRHIQRMLELCRDAGFEMWTFCRPEGYAFL